jgi:hypothetical protein
LGSSKEKGTDTAALQALNHLQTAAKFLPRSSHLQLQLGRAYCLLGDFEKSTLSYLNYTRMRPDNPLGQLELQFAFLYLCNQDELDSEYPASLCDNREVRDKVYERWEGEGENLDWLHSSVEDSYLSHRFIETLIGLDMISIIQGNLSPQQTFFYYVSKIAVNKSAPKNNNPALLTVHPVSLETSISGEQLRWVKTGTLLDSLQIQGKTAGVLWWTGCAMAAIEIKDGSDYTVTISALDAPPAPTQMRLEHNFIAVSEFDLAFEDMTWQDFSTTLFLDGGAHILSVCFLNDALIGGVDRNAFVYSVQIDRE